MGRDYNTLSLDDLIESIDALNVRAPRKYDDAYICKTFIGPKSESSKLFVSLPHAVLVNSKKPTKDVLYVYLKMDNTHRRKMLSLESAIMEVCKGRVAEWFEARHKITADMVDEYFQTGFTLDKLHRPLFKMRLYSPDSDIDFTSLPTNCAYHLALRLVGIRFQKQNISLVWDIVDIKEEAQTPHESSDEGMSDSDINTDSESVDDDADEELSESAKIKAAHDSLQADVQAAINIKEGELEALQKSLHELRNLLESATTLDEIEVARLRVAELQGSRTAGEPWK